MKTRFTQIEGGKGFWALLAALGVVILAGLGAELHMGGNGHWVTGMDNQIVWGMPHVFAIFLIVAASGALNVASISSVFGKTAYKPLARISAVLAVALLLGGLAVLVLDLGRPDRLIVAMTSYNFKSIFAWNIILYNGFMAIVLAYLWTMMDPSMSKYGKPVAFVAFVWRLILTTGTGSIFGFLVAREAYDAAILAPMFIAMSFSFGLAIFILLLLVTYRLTGRPLGNDVLQRMKNLQAIFIGAVLFFVLAYHVTNLYITQNHGFEAFILRDGGIYPTLFWGFQIVLGTLVPLALFYLPFTAKSRAALALGAALVILGGMAQVYIIVIGGQAYPMPLFPGYEVSSTFFDGVVAAYSPTFAEVVLGLSGVAIALAIVLVAIRNLRLLPERLGEASSEAEGADAALAKVNA